MTHRGLGVAVVARGAALVGAVALLVVDAHAQTTSTSAATGAAPSPVFGLMQGLVGLVIVIGLIFAAGWMMKKIGPRTSAGGLVQVVGGTSVGPREKVVVVRFGGQTLLLGVAPGRVSLLQAVETTDLTFDAPPGTTTAPSFVDRLRAARGRA